MAVQLRSALSIEASSRAVFFVLLSDCEGLLLVSLTTESQNFWITHYDPSLPDTIIDSPIARRSSRNSSASCQLVQSYSSERFSTYRSLWPSHLQRNHQGQLSSASEIRDYIYLASQLERSGLHVPQVVPAARIGRNGAQTG